MKKLNIALMLALVSSLTGCQMIREVNQSTSAIKRNRCAVESSTRAIEKNVEALERITGNLEEMEGA